MKKKKYILDGEFQSFDKPRPEAPPTIFDGFEVSWEEYVKFVGDTTFDNSIEYMKCTWDIDFFRNSKFYNYLKNKKRTKLIERMLDV